MFKFITTKELGKLTRWLRILGFDTVYYTLDNTGTLIIEALREDRVIVTRRKSKIGELKKIVVIDSEEVKTQLKELIDKLHLRVDKDKIFKRCVLCNELLEEVKKDEVKGKVPEYIFKTKSDFMMCIKCGHIYWQGSHWGNINQVINKLVDRQSASS